MEKIKVSAKDGLSATFTDCVFKLEQEGFLTVFDSNSKQTKAIFAPGEWRYVLVESQDVPRET